MSAPLAMIVGAVTVYLVYALYARRIDTNGIQSDLKHATPATLYMDGVGPTGGDSMTTLQLVVTRSLWLGVGAAAILAAGCAGMSNNNKGPIALSGTQEVPAVTTGASGSTDISVNSFKCPSSVSSNNCPTVFGTVVTSGIKGTAAHIHQGAPGQNGPVIVTLSKMDDNTWSVPSGTTLTDAQYDAYWTGLLYVNVHSDANKGGEIRAQLKP